MSDDIRDLVVPDLVVTVFQDEADTLVQLGQHAVRCDDPKLNLDLIGRKQVALLNSTRLAGDCYLVGVEEVVLVQVNPAFSSLREYLGLRALPEQLDADRRQSAVGRWRALLNVAHLLRREDYPTAVGVSSVNGLPHNSGDPFPVDALPKSIARMVWAGAQAQGVDPGMWGIPALGIMAGAIGAARVLRMKHSYSVPSTLWMVTVAPSGTGKSPPLHMLAAPLRERDKLLIEATNAAMAQYQARLEAAKRSKKNDVVQALTKPPRQACIVDDVTMEALVVRLADNAKGLTFIKDEVSSLFASFDAYRGGRGGDEQRLMEIYDSRQVKTDRKGDDRPTIVATRPCLTIVGTIQPQVLRKLMTQQRRDSGLAGRFLFGMPPAAVPPWTDCEIPVEVEDAYRKTITIMLDLAATNPPVALQLSRAAHALWKQFYDRIGNEVSAAIRAGNADLSSALVKLRSTALRFALVIAVTSAAEVGQAAAEGLDAVDEAAMANGIELANWFIGQLHKIQAEWRIAPDEPDDLVELIRRLGGRTTVRDLMRRTRRFRTAQAATAALNALAAAGKGRWQPKRAENGRTVTEFVLADPDDAADAADADTAG